MQLICTYTGYTTSTRTAVFEAQPPVVVTGFWGGSRTGAGLMTDGFTVSPSSASCSASRLSGIAATVWVAGSGFVAHSPGDDDRDWVGDCAVELRKHRGYTTSTRTALFTAVPAAVVVSGFSGGSRAGAGLMTDGFTVSPYSASCSATRLSGIAATVSLSDNSGLLREVSVTTTGTGSVTVQLSCTNTGYTTSTRTALFTAVPPVVITGFWGGWRTGAGLMTDGFTVSPSSASCSASRLSGIAATVSLSDNAGLLREVSVTTTGTGSVTVQLSCTNTGYTTSTRTAWFTAVPPVVVTGFWGGSRTGAGLMTDGFTVSPSSASCSASRLSGLSATVSVAGSGSSRAVWVTTTGTGSVTVQLSCANTGYGTSTRTAVFTAVAPVVVVSGFNGGWRTGAGVMTDGFTVDPFVALCSASRLSGIAATVSVSGSGSSRTVSVETTTTGSVTVELVCWKMGYSSAVVSAVFTAVPPAVVITGFWGGSRTGAGLITDTFTVSPSSASCSASHLSGIAATVSLSDNSGLLREVSVTTTGTGSVTVQLICTNTGYTTSTRTAWFTAVPPVVVTGFSGGSRTGAGVMTDTFTVSPSSASCSASRLSGIAATVWVAGSGSSRTVRVTTTGTGSVTVQLSCANTGYVTSSPTALFTAVPPEVVVSEFLGGSRAGPGLITDTFTVSPYSASCSATRLSGIAATVSFSDNAGLLREVSVTTTGTGSVTVQLSCTNTGYTTSTRTALFTAVPPVVITGFSGGSRTGAGVMTDGFTVSPSSALCSVSRLSGIAATVSFSDNAGLLREVSVTTTGTGEVTVQLSCTNTGYTTSTGTAVFEAQPPVKITGFDGDSGVGVMTDGFTVGPFGFAGDSGVGVMTDGFTVEPSGIAGVGAWVMTDEFAVDPSTASCSASQQSGVPATVSVSDSPWEVSVTTTGTGEVTVQLSCTNTGYVTGTATAVFTAMHIPAPPPSVVISYFDGGSRSGAGLITDDFSVKPSTASCRASHYSGIAADVWLSDNSGGLRTVSVWTTAPGSVTVRLRCWLAGHLSDTEYAVFTARTPPVEITGFDGVSGSSPLASGFTVEPSSALCFPLKGSGSDDVTLSWLDDSGRSRKLEVAKSTPGAVTVYMFCTEGPYNFDFATADFIVTEDEDETVDCVRTLELVANPDFTLEPEYVFYDGWLPVPDTDRCLSSVLGDTFTRHYANKFRFSTNSDVTISVFADPDTSRDPRLKLTVIKKRSGPPTAGDLSDTVITAVSDDTYVLTPGRYTIEVTTVEALQTGHFTLSAAALGGTGFDSIRATSVPPGQKVYPVAAGALEGIMKAAQNALTEDVYNCAANVPTRYQLTRNRLVALLLAISTNELLGDGPHALMNVGRSDWTAGQLTTSYHLPLHSFNTAAGNVRAFWHAGIGLWQIDDANGSGLNHAERAHSMTAAAKAADIFLIEYCKASGVGTLQKFMLALKPWYGCETNGVVGIKCYNTFLDVIAGDAFPEMRPSSDVRLYLTVDDDYADRAGGVRPRKCEWSTGGAAFDCFLYDMKNAQGKWWKGTPNGNTDIGINGGISPLACPFISFTQIWPGASSSQPLNHPEVLKKSGGLYKYVVFKDVDHECVFSGGSVPSGSDVIAAVPKGHNLRDIDGVGLTRADKWWYVDTVGGVGVEVCDDCELTDDDDED